MRTCEHCGDPIERLGPRGRFCGTTCRVRQSRGEEPRPVGACSESGVSLPGCRSDRLTCSDRCRARRSRTPGSRALSVVTFPPGCACSTPIETELPGGGATYCDSCGGSLPHLDWLGAAA